MRLVVAVCAVMLCSVVMMGQAPPNLLNGLPPQGSYDGGSADSVNLMNGNLVLHIPLPVDSPQRGQLAVKYYLVVNGKSWNVNLTNWRTMACTTDDVPQGPCAQGPILVSTASFGLSRNYSKVFEEGIGTDYSVSAPTGFTTWDGSSHPLVVSSVAGSYETSDISGYHVLVSGSDANGLAYNVTITDRNGTQYTGTFGQTLCTRSTSGSPGDMITVTSCKEYFVPSGMIDANGNVFTGPLGIPAINPFSNVPNTVAHLAVGSEVTGCLTSFGTPWVYNLSYPAPNGVTNQIKLCFAPYPNLVTSFSSPGINQFQNPYPIHNRPPVYLTNVILPDNTQWTVSYDSYGEITSVSTPTGASMQYSWTEAALPSCGGTTPVSRAVQSRTLRDVNTHAFVWNYQWGTQAGDGSLTHTVTDPLVNDTVHVFKSITIPPGNYCNFHEASTLNYQGTGGARQLVKQVDTTYSTPHVGYDTVPTDIKTTLSLSGKVSLVHRDYTPGLEANFATDGSVTAEKQYDWGQGAAGALLREVDTTYEWQVDSRYATAHMLDLAASAVTKNSAGTRVAETDTSYDESAYLTNYETTVGALPTGTHVAAPNPVRGNPTTVSRWLSTTGASILDHTNWYDTGEIYQTISPLGRTTTHSYDLAYAGALPTKTCNAKGQCVSGTYDVNAGLLTSLTDANGSYQASGLTQGDPAHTITYSYDLMRRLTAGVSPADTSGNHPQVSFSYPSATTIQRLKAISPGVNDTATINLDGLGHISGTQHVTPSGTAVVDMLYDGLGQMISVSNPYFSISDPTYGLVQKQYDALGRLIQTTKQDGSIATVSYSGNCSTTSDQAGKQRKTCIDALGRPTIAWEDPSGVNYETDYQYDALGNLLRVDQKGAAPSDSTKWRTRLFTYDSLSQLITASNPESGTFCYGVWAAGNCVNGYDNDGNLLMRTAPAPNQAGSATQTMSYCYDELHRMTKRDYISHTYNPPACPISAPAVSYTYDVGANSMGQLISISDQAGSGTYSYDALGRITQEQRTANGVTITISAGYDLADNMTSLTYPDGRLVSYRYNSGNLLNQVQFVNWSGTAVGYNYWSVNDTNFFASGVPKLASLGNGVNESTMLNPRLQLQQETVTSSVLGTFADHVYGYGAQNNGNLLSVADQLNSARTRNYTYDSLSRLATASEAGGRWGLGFVYDSWGNFLQQNLTAGTASTHTYTADPNNRLIGFGYDAAGNLTSDTTPGHMMSYTYDAENRISQVNSTAATYAYDGNGNRVRKDLPGTSTQYVYFGENVIAEKNITTGDWADYIFANGKRIARALALDNGLRIYGTRCSACGSQYSLFYLQNAAGLANYTIRSGDKLNLTQYQFSGSHGGIVIVFTDGTNTNWSVRDQDAYYLNDDGTQTVSHVRRIDLSSYAGKTIQSVAFNQETDTAAGAFAIIYEQVAMISTDGTVQPIYTGEANSPVSSISASSGVTGTGSHVDVNHGKAIYPVSTTTYYHKDQLGSSTLTTAGYGWPVWQGTYLPYGEEYSPQVTDGEHYKFTGKERDYESGLDYFGARYYGNGWGRFTKPDPTNGSLLHVINPQRWNMYAYGMNNPSFYVDPDGRDAIAANFTKEVPMGGHQGIVVVHADGTAKYARFGPVGGNKADADGKIDTHDLTPVKFGADGLPTDASYKLLAEELAKAEGQPVDTVRLNYFKTSEADSIALDYMIKHWKALSDQHKAQHYNFTNNNCATFCIAGLLQAHVVSKEAADLLSRVPNALFKQLSKLAQENFSKGQREKVTHRLLPPCGEKGQPRCQ